MTPTEYGALCALHAQGRLDGKANTEYLCGDEWMTTSIHEPFNYTNAIKYQWRTIDPLREYKEAFAAGKRVEYRNAIHPEWEVCTALCAWLSTFEYRIVEPKTVKPKTVKLYPFAFQAPSLDQAKAICEANGFAVVHDSFICNAMISLRAQSLSLYICGKHDEANEVMCLVNKIEAAKEKQ
jgi:hypothetical protein